MAGGAPGRGLAVFWLCVESLRGSIQTSSFPVGWFRFPAGHGVQHADILHLNLRCNKAGLLRRPQSTCMLCGSAGNIRALGSAWQGVAVCVGLLLA
jgi:hypothetical protein